MAVLRTPWEWYRSLEITWRVAIAASWLLFVAVTVLRDDGEAGAELAPVDAPTTTAVAAEAPGAPDGEAASTSEGQPSQTATGPRWRYVDRSGATHEVSCGNGTSCRRGVPAVVVTIDSFARNGMCLGVEGELDFWRAEVHLAGSTPPAGAMAFAAYADDTLAAIGC
jgi:hypothetical protein